MATAPADLTPTDRIPGLRYVSDAEPGIRRRRAGKGFVYIAPGGTRVTGAERQRIKELAIPPAWTDVWICPSANGHILATGRDAKGRKQYRYHPRWRQTRDGHKFERTLAFAEALPGLRRRVRKDMAQPGLGMEKVVATVVALLDSCFARIGNETYARSNGSFGLTTLRARHARFDGSTLRLRYKGKAGKEHEAYIDDPRIVHIVRRCQEIEGQILFQHLEDGEPRPIGSASVNSYLRSHTGADFSAKDFRTWAATVRCAVELCAGEATKAATDRERQTAIVAAIDAVAADLGNTRAVCRASYVHPDVLEGYLDGSLQRSHQRRSTVGASSLRGLSADERFVLAFLRSRARATGRRAA
jgi:DNA topoisomerase-1